MVMFTAEEIKELRIRSGLSLAAFGALVGAAESTVCKWESGTRHPKYVTHIKLNEVAAKYSKPSRKRELANVK